MEEGKQRRKVGRLRPLRPKTPEEQRAHLEYAYLVNQEADIANNDARKYEDLRMRADGSPSAVPPHPTLPLSLWAVVEEAPDGEEHESVHDRLRGYQEWLRVLRRNGLYEGPTRLRFVNREESADAGGTDQG